MALVEAFLQEPVVLNVWIAVRSDGLAGSGTAADPFNGITKQHPAVPISLRLTSHPSNREAEATVLSPNNPFSEGDVVAISAVSGLGSAVWNGTFGIYNVLTTTFNFLLATETANPQGTPTAARFTFRFDETMRKIGPSTRIHIGPGIFQTRGFAHGDGRGWQPESCQNIVGAGVDVTILQLVGAHQADEHYHAIGMPIEPEVGATVAITPLQSFAVSDLTIDCNVDHQTTPPTDGYPSVACGAVRICGGGCRLQNVKAINWGTKSLKQGCFVLSIIQASGQPSDTNANPIITETQHNRIEDCIAVQPSRKNARESTVLHVGGLKNATNHAQGFGQAAYIWKNFVDCAFSANDGRAIPSGFATSKSGTGIEASLGTFVGKRPHWLTPMNVGELFRFYSPRNPSSRWNGYFRLESVLSGDSIRVILGSAPPNTNDDSGFVVMGTEFRSIGLGSCLNAVVEQNQIHNCWIGGPYQSPLDDDAEFAPDVPPTLATEEQLDPLNSLNTRSLIVRNNHYRNVAIGPYFNAGGSVSDSSLVEFDQ